MAKDKRVSTKWWVANEDDAYQIALYFHGEGRPGHYNFKEYSTMIEMAIVGEPKKLILAILEWVMSMEADHEEALVVEGGDPSAFVAAHVWKRWAKDNGKGRYREIEVV